MSLLTGLAFAAAADAEGRAGDGGEASVTNRPVRIPAYGYVSSDACRSCHPGRYESWYTSYHRTMTQVASPTSVVGRFDGRPVEALGTRLVPRSDGHEFWSDVETAPGMEMIGAKRRVAMTTGSHHQQFYWLEMP